MNQEGENQIKLSANGLPVLDQFSEVGFVDCTFRITGMKHSAGRYSFHLSASHHDRVVGFDVSLLDHIGPGFDTDLNVLKDNVYRQGVEFRRSGPESDTLMTALSEMYRLNLGVRVMVDSLSFTAIALHNEPVDLRSQTVKIKLFGKDAEPLVEEDYFEAFFNISLRDQVVYWNEKDADYRASLVRGLSAQRC